MTNVASSAPKMLYPEQKHADDKPWIRQKQEPALWYMRFRRYVEMGPKRSMRAAIAAEPDSKRVAKGCKTPVLKLSDISIPGAWTRAARVWHWKERCESYDLYQIEKQADAVRQTVSLAIYASKSFRVLQLDYLARALHEWIKSGTVIEDKKDFLAIVKVYQSIMRDMATEMQGIDGIENVQCDANVFEYIKKEVEREEEAERLKGIDNHARNQALFAKFD